MMRDLLENLIPERFKKTQISEAVEEAEVDLPTNEQAWSGDSSIYSKNNFEKYNPDALIGKKGFTIYRQMMTDEQVKAVVKFKRDAITSRDYFFELDPVKSGLSEDEVKFRINLFKEIINRMGGSWTDALNGMMSAIYNGFSMTEKLFDTFEFQGRSWWGINKLKLKPYDTFYFNVDDFGNILSVTQKWEGKEQFIDLIKFVHFVVNPDVDEHYGQSDLRECYRAWFGKDNVIKFRNIWLEKHAGGFRTVKPTDGSTIQIGSPEYVAWQNILGSINMSTGIIAPANREITSEYPSNNVAYKEAIEDYDMAIARGLLVPNLIGISPQGDHGSLSQADSQVEVFMWTLQADTDRLEDALNEQLFRNLGEGNFGDDWWPRFRFKPVSSSKQQNIINTWKELVGVQAVTPTDKDEAHIRELMDFPEAAKDEDDNTNDLNPKMDGAQVSSLLEITEKVRSGSLAPEAAIKVIQLAFPLDEEGAREIIDSIEVKPETEPVVDENGNPVKPDEETDENGNPIKPATPVAEAEPTEEELEAAKKQKDSTIIGKGVVSVSSFEKAVKRVDFAVIGKTAEDGIETSTDVVGSIMGSMYDELLIRLADVDVEKVGKIKYDAKLTAKLRRSVKKTLNEGWDVGEKHASAEINRAKQEPFKASAERLKFIGEEFFNLKSFSITGNLTENTLQIIKNAILNGIKNESALSEVKNVIYNNLASAGYLSVEDAKEALGQALGVDNPDARINTIIRTNTFEAINEARFNYFTDPGLDDFVEALEYSAILDSRTTSICQHLDGQIHASNSETWNTYRPPNHFNCRSLLVPVTELDTWNEDEEPTISPQKGFE